MAFVALKNGTGELLGVSRLVLDPDRTKGEFGILVRSDLHGHGLGWNLMNALMNYARCEGVEEITGFVHIENQLMLKMASELGFDAHHVPDAPLVREVVWRPGTVSAVADPYSNLRAKKSGGINLPLPRILAPDTNSIHFDD